jgi:site-specific DNA recombinase
MASLKPHPPFNVLLVTDRDRLGREQVETSYLLKTLLQAGVRVFECGEGDGREITLSSPTDKVLLAVTSFAAELEREQARVRTRAALEHRARAGRLTGGRILAYEPVRTADGHATRAIVEAEADVVVRRIFALARDGYGVKRIAATLNGDAAPAPRKAGRVAGWAPSTVRGVLPHELHRGTLIWSRHAQGGRLGAAPALAARRVRGGARGHPRVAHRG